MIKNDKSNKLINKDVYCIHTSTSEFLRRERLWIATDQTQNYHMTICPLQLVVVTTCP